MSNAYAVENEYDSVVQNYHHTSTEKEISDEYCTPLSEPIIPTGKEIPNTDDYCTPLSEPIIPNGKEIPNADDYCTPLSEPIIPTNGVRQLKSLNATTHYQFENELSKNNAEIYDSATTITHDPSSPNTSTNHYFNPPGTIGGKESTGNIYECAIDNFREKQNEDSEYAVVDKTRKTSNKPKVRGSIENKRLANKSSKTETYGDSYSSKPNVNENIENKRPASKSSKTEERGDSYTSLKNLMTKKSGGIFKRGKVVKWIVYGVIVLLLVTVCYLSYECHELNEKMARNEQRIRHQRSEWKSALQSQDKQRLNDTYLTDIKFNKTAHFVKNALQKEREQRIDETNLNKLKINETANFVKEVDSRLQKVIFSGVLLRFEPPENEDKNSRAGLIQLLQHGQWYYILSWQYGFHKEEAKIVCQTMGYATGKYDDGRYNKQEQSRDGEKLNVRIDCHGNEKTILECSITPEDYSYFPYFEIIGVSCKNHL